MSLRNALHPSIGFALLLLILVAGRCVAEDQAPKPAAAPAPAQYFAIQVVDADTGRGVPLVELSTNGRTRYYTDSNGLVAFYEPGLMGQKVFFHVKSHGYEYPEDASQLRGLSLQTTPGGSATVKMTRVNIAERLYRMTGEGIYRDTVLLGRKAPIQHPTLNGGAMGSDSVVNAIYRGKLYWVWGDTFRADRGMPNFNASGATSELPGQGGLDPEKGVELAYCLGDDGIARDMCRIPGGGLTWIMGMVVLPDKDGQERLCGTYVKVQPPLTIIRRGLATFDDASGQFVRAKDLALAQPIFPQGHPLTVKVGDTPYIYFAHGLEMVRFPARVEAMLDPSTWEAYTCLLDGSTLEAPKFDRDASDRLQYRWRHNAPTFDFKQLQPWLKEGKMKPGEANLHIFDTDTGKPAIVHGGSVNWNSYRGRYVGILLEVAGTSMLGEIWYAEADAPEGPWGYTRKIITHDKYSFYNPKQHPYFDQKDGRIIYLEGTYTASFSGNTELTPRYEYNQMMYRLDLADARLQLPAPFYRTGGADAPGLAAGKNLADKWRELPVAFYAPLQPAPATVPVYAGVGDTLTLTAADQKVKPLFYALPTDAATPPETTSPLYEFTRQADGARYYTLDPQWKGAGFQRTEKPMCRVWKDPRA